MTILSKKPELEPCEADPPFTITEREGRRYIDSEDVCDLIECAEEIDESGGKHDCTWSIHLINIDGTLYRFEVECSYEGGANPGGHDIELEPVVVEPCDGWKVVPLSKASPLSEVDDERPDFAGFAAKLRAEADGTAEIWRTRPEAPDKQREIGALRDLADKVEQVGKLYGFI